MRKYNNNGSDFDDEFEDGSDNDKKPFRKLHEHLVKQVVQALDEIFEQKKYADKVIEKYLKKNKKWGSRDRKFFAESVYDIVRWWRKYYILALDKDIDCGHQLKESDFWKIWAVQWTLQGQKVPDFLPTPSLYFRDLEKKELKLKTVAQKEAFPDWIFKLGEQAYGKKWIHILYSLNEVAQVYLRTNALKTTPQKLIEDLEQEGVETIKEMDDDLPLCLKLTERKNVFATKAFKSGFFEVQDAGSQLIVPLLDIKPGLRVVDACAGAGGKTLHMSSLMKNKGKIIAMDIFEWKLQELKIRAKRNGVDIIETKLIDSSKVIKRLEKSADRVLLDVPCSGLGVIKRNPDTKWKLAQGDVDQLIKTQKEILSQYSGMVKKGGILVYATCSLLPQENELQVQAFLDSNPGWKLDDELFVRPDLTGFDGFYAAKLIREVD